MIETTTTTTTTTTRLPFCSYPKAEDIESHGLFLLPDELPLLDAEALNRYRTRRYSTVSLGNLSDLHVFQVSEMIAKSFVENEPMTKHLKIPKEAPNNLSDFVHNDDFGSAVFGDWTHENIMLWFVRLFILTDPSDPVDKIQKSKINFEISKAILDENSKPIAGILNTILHSEPESFRTGDVFLDIIASVNKPIIDLIHELESQAIIGLGEKFPDFLEAVSLNQVISSFMFAKAKEVPTKDALEVILISIEDLKNQGYKYFVSCATNKWSGAVLEALGGVRVYFVPYRKEPKVAKEEFASPFESYSADGYLSAKDSGAMFYVLKLN